MPTEYFSDPKTDGERQLRAVPLSLNAISKKCGIAKSQIHYYRRGEKVPDETTAETIELHLSIPRAAWKQRLSRETTTKSEPPALPVDEEFDPAASGESAKDAARAHLKNVRSLRRAAQTQDRSDLPKWVELERRAVLDLARFSGELTAADENKLCETRQWRTLRDEVLGALEPYPDALRAVIAKLETLNA